MSPPEKKKRKRLHKNKSSLVLAQTPQFLSLPHDLVVTCLARISKSYYPTLSLVSKSFRSLIASPELYQTRSLLNRTESFLYVCLHFHRDLGLTLTLAGSPSVGDLTEHQIMTQRKRRTSMGNILVPISSPSPVEVYSSSHVVVGSDIYEIGGHINWVPSSSVSVLDFWSHTWHKAPNMWEKREDLSANVIDGKIYAVGGRRKGNFSGWIEIFDPKTQIWKHVSSPGTEIYDREDIETVVIDGKLYIYDRIGMSYNPKDGIFECVKGIKNIFKGWEDNHCLINNILFYHHKKRVFKWYDNKVRKWKKLKGLKGLPEFPSSSYIELADYGGKMVILWDERVLDHGYIIRRTRIWCAEIALERCSNEDEISGKVEWFDVVLDVPFSSDIECVLSATV